MNDEPEPDGGRREFLRMSLASAGLGWGAAHWATIVAASEQAHARAAAGERDFAFLTTAQARDVEAIAAQIVPSGATPGATEAGVVHFIDQVHAGLFKARAAELRARLEEFAAAFVAAHPGEGQFADLAPQAQVDYLRSIESSPSFALLRSLTIMGLLASPVYGGNRGSSGWKLVGFEDRHVWAAPFGYYDRDYPGFVADDVAAQAEPAR